MAVQKLGESTLENTQDKFQLHFTTSYAITKQKTKKNKKTLTSKQQPGMGSGDWGWGAMWAVTPPMNECIGLLFKKYPLLDKN